MSIMEDFVVIDTQVEDDSESVYSDCVVNSEDENKIVDEVQEIIVGNYPQQNKYDDNISIAGWSEISAPSVRSIQSSFFGSRNTPSPRNKKLSSEIQYPVNTDDSKQVNPNHSSSSIPFSWAEITKIQPTFHHKSSIHHHHHHHHHKTDHIKNYPAKSTSASVSAIRTDGSNTSNNNNDNIFNKNTDTNNNNSNDKLPQISEEDCHANKEDFGRGPRRAGKKGSRIKYPNGKKASRRNSRK